LLGAFVLVVPPARASEIGHEIVAQIREETYRYYMDTQLFTRVGDDRGYDSPQHDLARENIVAIFESYGLDVELHPFEYYGGTYYNVVATQIGMVYPEAQYIVGAHYDSESNPGADDDASGVAGLLEIARVFSAYETACTVKYIAFDLEEWGLIGSEAYVVDHFDDDIRGMVQMDMISWNNGTLMCQIRGAGECDPIKNALADAFAEYVTGVTAEIQGPLGMYASDHDSFEDAGFQACLLIERGWRFNPCYHLPSDSVDMRGGYVDYWYARELIRGVAGFLADHALADYPYDCDGDGVVDATQIDDDPSLDCNGNHILDICEFAGDLDENGNGVPDLCDIYAGTSPDCNGNWIPDEVEPGYGEDCNGNAVPDLCDVATRESEDLNRNRVPDECEIHGTIYVDDDAPNDPGPGDPGLSDPDEDGSAEHPFDSIAEAVAMSLSGDEILVKSGVYRGDGNRRMSLQGRCLVLRSESGPENCVIDLEGSAWALDVSFGQGPETVIEGFTIANGSASYAAGMYIRSSSPTISTCIFAGNVATWSYGGAVLSIYSDSSFINCLFFDNHTAGYDGQGGALYCFGGSPVLGQCTFVGNVATERGGAVTISDGAAAILNCVLWDNYAPAGPQLALEEEYWDPSVYVSYTDMSGGADAVWVDDDGLLEWGPGNIDADPLFLDPNNADLRLLPGSPCIDAADNSAVPADTLDLDGDGDTDEPIPFDLDGNPRFVDDPGMPDCGNGTPPLVDMGAYEFQGETCFGDLDGDNAIGLTDLAELLSNYGATSGAVYGDGDLDRDGDVDLADLAALLGVYGTTCE